MPINRLLKDSKLKPEEIERLNRAYTLALRSLDLVDRDDPLTKTIAKKVIEVGATGVLDPVEISRIAIERMGLS
jgi:hypothetical protein